jgi:hypothetical protein
MFTLFHDEKMMYQIRAEELEMLYQEREIINPPQPNTYTARFPQHALICR